MQSDLFTCTLQILAQKMQFKAVFFKGVSYKRCKINMLLVGNISYNVVL